MGKVEAWQCPHCTSLFHGKRAMEKCRRECLKHIKEEKAAETRR